MKKCTGCDKELSSGLVICQDCAKELQRLREENEKLKKELKFYRKQPCCKNCAIGEFAGEIEPIDPELSDLIADRICEGCLYQTNISSLYPEWVKDEVSNRIPAVKEKIQDWLDSSGDEETQELCKAGLERMGKWEKYAKDLEERHVR